MSFAAFPIRRTSAAISKSTAAVRRRNGVLVLSKTTGIMGVEPTAVIIQRGENHD